MKSKLKGYIAGSNKQVMAGIENALLAAPTPTQFKSIFD